MRLKGIRRSRNVEDRRRSGKAGAGIGGVGLLVVVVIAYFAGVDITPLLQGQDPFAQGETQRELSPCPRPRS